MILKFKSIDHNPFIIYTYTQFYIISSSRRDRRDRHGRRDHRGGRDYYDHSRDPKHHFYYEVSHYHHSM